MQTTTEGPNINFITRMFLHSRVGTLITYSGILSLEYGTKDDPFSPEQFVHPLCFIAERPQVVGQPPSFPPGLPINQAAFLLEIPRPSEFRAATATVALASIWVKQGGAVAGVLTATADLWQVDIGTALPAPNIVCLSVVVQGRQSHIYSVGYRVDVLTTRTAYGKRFPIVKLLQVPSIGTAKSSTQPIE
jgi:hypothetical protein